MRSWGRECNAEGRAWPTRLLAIVILIGAFSSMSIWGWALTFGPLQQIDGPPTIIGPTATAAADVDGDGDMDVVAALIEANWVAWYDNNGALNPLFTRNLIDSALQEPSCVLAVDLDGDLDVDVLAATATNSDDKVIWYENDGNTSPSFTTHVITDQLGYVKDIHVADLNGDGRLDVLSTSLADNLVVWYESDGAAPPTFTAHTITDQGAYPGSVYTADVNKDNDLDILLASSNGDTVAWYENGGGSAPTFTPHVISSDLPTPNCVRAADLDDDGDVDVVATSWWDDKTVWYESDGSTSPTFATHVLAEDPDGSASNPASDGFADGPAALWLVDLDGDGDQDILEGSRLDERIAWFENDGAQPPTFTPYTIIKYEDSDDSFCSLTASDLDRDGDLDILSFFQLENLLFWLENKEIDLSGAYNWELYR